MAAKPVSEMLESFGIKAAPLTLICPFLSSGGKAQSVRSFPLIMFSCLCSVPAPHQRQQFEKLLRAWMDLAMKMEDVPGQLPLCSLAKKCAPHS